MEGSDDFYLFVKSGWTSWSVWSSLKAEKVLIASGSAGQACPAHTRNAPNLAEGFKEWKFNKAEDHGVYCVILDWKEGGVAIRCSVHNK